MDTAKWKKLKKSLWLSVLLWSLAGAALSFYLWGSTASVFSLLGTACLLGGFYVTELLIGVLAGVKKANPTAIGLLFLAKLTWWGGIFWLSRHLTPSTQAPVAVGMGAFLFSLVSLVLLRYGMPKISDAEVPGP